MSFPGCTSYPMKLYIMQHFDSDSGTYEYVAYKSPDECVGKTQSRQVAVFTFEKEVKVVNKTEVVG